MLGHREIEDVRAGLIFSNECKRLGRGDPLPAEQANPPNPHAATTTTAPSTHSRAPPPPVTFLRTNLSPPGCRPPLLPSCFRCCRCRFDANRAGAAAAAAVARGRPSVRPPGCALRSWASTTHPSRLTLFLPASFPSPFSPSLLSLQSPAA